VNRFHSLLSSIFQHAVRQGLADVNPLAAGSVPWSKESKIHVRYLADDEQRRVVAAIRRGLPKKVLELELAILTGMRRGEQFNSRWSDWKRKEECLRSLERPVCARYEIIAPRAIACCVCDNARLGAGVYHAGANEVTRDRRVWFERAVRKANLQQAFRYHDLRHTFCSRLVAAGVPLLDVKELAGHKSYSTTLRYAHLSPDQLKRAVRKSAFSVLDWMPYPIRRLRIYWHF